MKYLISESEKREILGLYGITRQEEKRPFGILSECKFTSDGKFVVYEGIAFSCETGDQVPLNEAWTLSDTLHTIGDITSAGIDFVVPGSGAVIDIINAVSYFIEAQFQKDPVKKQSLYVMGAITAAFVIIPGPLQAVATPLKQFVKTGKAVKSAAVAGGIKLVGKSISTILTAIPALVNRALKTKLGQRVLGRYSKYITKYLDNILTGVKTAVGTFAESEVGNAAVSMATAKAGAKVGKEALTDVTKKSLFGFFKRTPKVLKGATVLRKAGFAVGKSYRYAGPKGMTTIVIKEINDEAVIITGKLFGQAAVPINTFLQKSIGAPWMRRGSSVMVPLFVKRFANMLLPDGSGINYQVLEQLPDANPDETSQESLSYLEDELAAYQGDTRQYTVNPTVQTFQNGLIQAGYTLPRFGADGKFGPETQEQLKRFQTDNQLESSTGKMDRLTAKTLAKVLADKNPQGTIDLQNSLNSI